MRKAKPTYQQLEKRLAEIEPVIEALKHLEVDAVVGEEKIAFLLLQEVEEALVESETKFHALFDLPGVGVIQADAPGFRFTRVNARVCAMTGYGPDELQAKTWLEPTHPDDRPKDMQELTQVLSGKRDSWSMEKRCVRKDGSVLQARVHAAALRDSDGRVVRIVAMIEDVSTCNPMEQELQGSCTEVEQRAQKPTRSKKISVKSVNRSIGRKPSGKKRRPRR